MPGYAAFRYAVTAFLALNNMLDIANDNALFDRLLGYSRPEFEDWLDRISEHGSVTG